MFSGRTDRHRVGLGESRPSTLRRGAPRDFGERGAEVDEQLQQILAAAVAGSGRPGVLSLLGTILDVLRARGIEHGLIGGAAMAAHGVIRATLDTDVLVVDGAVLDGVVWKEALPDGTDLEIRVGDADDPLAGMVRMRSGMEIVDLVVGRGSWQRAMLSRATPVTTPDGELPVVDRADLILLKLYAGGPQDRLDIQLLMDRAEGAVAASVEERISSAPNIVQKNWTALRATKG